MRGHFSFPCTGPPGVAETCNPAPILTVEFRASNLRAISVGEASEFEGFNAWISHKPGMKLMGAPVVLSTGKKWKKT